MNSLKNFLIQHGEKVVVAIIALICCVSIAGMLARDSKLLELPDGRVVTVDQNEIKSKLEQLRQHLTSNMRVFPDPKAEKVSHELARRILDGLNNPAKTNLEWFAYIQTPPVGVPPLFSRPVPTEPRNIPAEYRTRFGNPEDVRIMASVDSVLVLCKDSQYLNFPEPGSRRMTLWRKAVGSGKEQLSPEVRGLLLRSPRTESVAGKEELAQAAPAAAPAAAPDMPGAPGMPGTGPKNTGAMAPATPAPGAAAPSNVNMLAGFFGGNSGAGTQAAAATGEVTLEAYKRNIADADQRALNDMMAVCTPASVVASGWELVVPKMYALKVEPTEEILQQILEGKMSPDIVEMTEEEIAEYNAKKAASDAEKNAALKKEEKKPVAKTATLSWDDVITPKSGGATGKDAAKDKAGQTDKAAVVEQEGPRYYVYVDRNIQQNMVYRYSVIASLRPRMPEKEILDKEEHAGWELYCELDGISGNPPAGGDFALPSRMIKPLIEKEMPAKRKGIEGVRLSFTPCYLSASASAAASTKSAASAAGQPMDKPADTARANDDSVKVKRKELRDEKGQLTSLGWAYKHQEYCYSDFVYTDLVLTPKEFELELRAALGAPTPQVTIRVHKVEKTGEMKVAQFTIVPEQLANSPVWSDFLAKDARGNPVWPPKILPLQDVYEKLAGIKPKMIGDELPNKGDFRTGWGVVEIRPYMRQGKVIRLDSKTGEWKDGGAIPPFKEWAVIIAEVNPPKGQPRRFLRLFKPGPTPKDPAVRKYEYEYIWEPELNEKIEKKRSAVEGKSGDTPTAKPGVSK